ncbi:MAG: peptide chain release factor N(5)-glutamine methyltransferase [Aquificaceae bacterium]|uniref:peptide chain release factor N(5)-glutamine methyltransferase n=1 Tax=Hydrogenobacter sp. Uz 6-8 TaxID=3384828 RepID=UPI0030B2D727
MKVRQLLQKPSRASLRDRALLLAHLLGTDHKELYFMEGLEVPPEVEERFFRELSRLEEGYPLQYILGEWDFYGMTFFVEEGVLIPRPETEILVEEVLKRLPEDKPLLGLELGVGTGCISVSLLYYRTNLRMLGSDISLRALRLTRKNALRHGVSDRLLLFAGDLFTPLKPYPFDLLVSNPPYIPEAHWEKLPKSIRIEGYSSLIGGVRGWEFYERLAAGVADYLKPGGLIALEIGHDQGEVVRRLFEEKGFKVETIRDYSGQERVVLGWRY